MLCRRKMQAGPTSPCSTEYPCSGGVCAASSTSSGSPVPEPAAPERGFPSCEWSGHQWQGGGKHGPPPPPLPAAAPRGIPARPYFWEPSLRGLGAVAHGWGLPPRHRTCLAPGGLAGADRRAATGDLRFLWNIWGYAGQARGGGCRARAHNPPDYSPLGRPAPDVGSRPAVPQSRSHPARARRIPGTHRAPALSPPPVTCPKAEGGRGPGSSAAR